MIFHSSSIEKVMRALNSVEINNAPKEIFFIGKIGLLTFAPKVAIVGSRKASEDGIRRTKNFARELARRGITVVSGLAEGIDTAAHTSAIENGGNTIAVLGTPLDRVYPTQNAALQKEIMQNHLCISQFSSGMSFNPKFFPQRNRTMALISDATVIMEAKDGSGTFNQGWEALRLGRPLFIAKSTIEKSDSTWPEKFLRYGAQILIDDDLEDLIESLPPQINVIAS